MPQHKQPIKPLAGELLTEKDLAERTRYSAIYFRIMRHKGEGPPYLKINRSIRYDPRDVAEWLESKKVG